MEYSEKAVLIPADGMLFEGTFIMPKKAKGIVIFAHGSGSSRKSPRNNFVAKVLRENGIGTLLFDLLSEEEDRIYDNRFNIPLLSRRLLAATKWLRSQPEGKGRKIGYFGSSTGSAAALTAATEPGNRIDAVVSRGGRPDLAMMVLGMLKSPTLLIVGGDDDVVIGMNQDAYLHMKCEKEMSIIPRAGHLFEEPGSLEDVAKQAARWFREYLK